MPCYSTWRHCVSRNCTCLYLLCFLMHFFHILLSGWLTSRSMEYVMLYMFVVYHVCCVCYVMYVTWPYVSLRYVKIANITKWLNLCGHFLVWTSCQAHPASCTLGTGVLSQGVKRGRGVILTPHPVLLVRLRRARATSLLHPSTIHGVFVLLSNVY
jgi:hypothetical protein